MAFQVSPGVLVQERDLTRIIPAVSTSVGAFAGQFTQGPLDEIVSITSEQELV
jgi:phage tail sheath protein FI